LLRSGQILEKQRSCARAIEIYKELEEIADLMDNVIAAQTGLMRCHHLMEDHENTIIYARKLIEGDKTPVQTVQEAHLLFGRSALAKNDFPAAKKAFSEVAKGSSGEATAEAKYSLGLIQFNNSEYKLSQEQCYKVINQVPSYEYWIGKSFILLGDNYLALGDTFQAKHTYRSIIDNYNGEKDDKEDLISIAQEKYNTIIKKEAEIQQSEIQRKEEEFYNAEQDTTETPLEPEDTINE
jgi:tetratricopeptide (TPR) repeat protein